MDADSLTRNPERVTAARSFLMDAHGHGKRGADELHAHALAMSRWSDIDAYTVWLAISLEWEETRRCAWRRDPNQAGGVRA